uniref:Uncharacterized protein n=1 Tax=Panagrolaimus superbus TaxID=310955 RepID=A0A914YH90_9BILA
MDFTGPIYINMREIVKDIDVIVKELISVASRPEKSEDDHNLLQTLPRLFAKKEREYEKLCKIYQHRFKVKKYIEELEKVTSVQDRKMQLLSESFGKIYNNLSELKRRVEVQTGLNDSEVFLNNDDIIKAAGLYSRSHSVCAPDKNLNKFRPYPTIIELKKGRLAQMTAKNIAFKQQQEQQHQQPDIPYILSMNGQDLKEKLQIYPTLLNSSASNSSYMERLKQNSEKKPKSNKIWTHYREPVESVKVTEWNDKALNPQGYIETYTDSNNKTDGKPDNDDNEPRRPQTPEYPLVNLVPMQEKHSIFYKALISGDEEDLFPNEERLNQPSVQSCNMVDGDNSEIYERFQEIAEYSKQKYYNSFQEEEFPWLQIPGKEKLKKKPNFRFRLTSPAYFGEQQRITKKIIWNAKYNRFYRNYKYRVPKLCAQSFTFPHPRREKDHHHQLNQFEAIWNVRKWNLNTSISNPNA